MDIGIDVAQIDDVRHNSKKHNLSSKYFQRTLTNKFTNYTWIYLFIFN